MCGVPNAANVWYVAWDADPVRMRKLYGDFGGANPLVHTRIGNRNVLAACRRRGGSKPKRGTNSIEVVVM